MKVYHNIVQGTPEWFELKKLKLSASKATAIGACSKGLNTLVRELVQSYVEVIPEAKYTSSDMERGNVLEDVARLVYSMKENVEVEQVGFIEYNDYVGYSPDGLVNQDILIEIKARNNAKHYALLMGHEDVDSGTKNQIQHGLLVTGRKYGDFISYNPNFKESIFIKRFEVDKEYQKKLLAGFKLGEELIKTELENAKQKGLI